MTGNTTHALGSIFHGEPFAISPMPVPHSVAIAPTDKGAFLLYLDEFGNYFTDTWHESLDMAKAQATFEFAVSEGDWQATCEESRLRLEGWAEGPCNRPNKEVE